MSVFQALKDNEVSQIRQILHKTPELKGHEVQTAKFIQDYLNEANIPNQRVGNDVFVDIQAPMAVQTLLFACNISAQPITEKTGLTFASIRGGIMHASGNDAHIAILLTIAKELFAHQAELKINVKIAFYSDAKESIQNGILNNGVVAAFKLQINPNSYSGDILVKKSEYLPSNDNFEITIKNKNGENSPISHIIAQIIENLYTLIPIKFQNSSNSLISVCNIECGTSFDISPSFGTIRGNIQTFDAEIRSLTPVYIKQVIGCIVAAFDVEYEFKLFEGAPSVYNNEILSDKVSNVAKDIGNLIPLKGEKMHGDNFSYISERIPSCLFEIGCTAPTQKEKYPLNSEYFNLDENCMQTGIDLLSNIALQFK